MPEQQYLKRELDHRFEDLFKRMDKQDDSLQRIEDQTIKTNGRATRLEDKVSDYNDIKKSVAAHENYKWWLAGVAVAITVTGLLAIKQMVRQEFTQLVQIEKIHSVKKE